MIRLALPVTGLLLAAGLLLPTPVAAHPLGNFTINHYAGLRVANDRILLDVVIDQAEIPTFQARLDFDTDGDGELSDTETDQGRLAACTDLAGSLELSVAGSPRSLGLLAAGLSFPPGAGGLPTMRTVCVYESRLDAGLSAATTISFADWSFPERIGWREIVVAGSGVTISAMGDEVRTSGLSERLTAYPEELLRQAPADAEVSFSAAPGGPEVPAWNIPDAHPVPGAATPVGSAPAVPAEAAAAAVPGGVVAGDLPAIFRATDLTPFVLLLSVVTAAGLGAAHALTPGHGKTLMAAYLVGTRGTPAHAAGLGLSVALSHTLGILVLAALVVGAQGVLPPDVVATVTPVVAAISIVAIGAWMLYGEARRRWSAAASDHDHEHDHGHEHPHEHPHEHEHERDHGHEHARDQRHGHGGRRHSHVPSSGSTISWRSLFILGLAGGLIPSASALLILLGAIAAGRPAFGFVLVVAFGLGMALVMGGIGAALVMARSRLDRIDATNPIGRARDYLPLAASVVVLAFGVYLTVQAVTGGTTL